MNLANLLHIDELPPQARETIQAHVDAEKAIIAAELRFGALGRALKSGLVVLDDQGIVVFVNDLVAALLGVARTEILGRACLDLVAAFVEDPAEVVSDQLQRLRSGHADISELRIRRAGKPTTPVRITPFPLFDPRGDFLGSFALVEPCDETGMVWGREIASGPPSPFEGRLSRLSAREREVLNHRLEGSSVSEIATRLSISHHTVRNHLKRIYGKLEVRSEPELLRALVKHWFAGTPPPL